jgi:hypothetical protein
MKIALPDVTAYPPLVFALAASLALSDAALVSRLEPATVTAWKAYAAAVERRRAREAADGRRFLVADFQPTAAADRRAILAGQLLVRKLEGQPSGADGIDVHAGRVHHWRGAVFISGTDAPALVARIERSDPPAVQDDVVQSAIVSRSPGAVHTYLRLQRTKIVTAVYNTEHDVTFAVLGPTRAESRSVSTKIAELRHAGTPQEVELPEGDDRGFLWRLNGYWRYETVPGGVIAECESLSLSRDVPALLDYIVGGMVNSTAREAMETTLRALRTRYQSSSKAARAVDGSTMAKATSTPAAAATSRMPQGSRVTSATVPSIASAAATTTSPAKRHRVD